jgi:4-hydroxybenzoate polyprenyltransferase
MFTTTRLTRLTNQLTRFHPFWQLMRFDRPIGTLLLLWPTLWALWIAGEGSPSWNVVVIFVLGTIIMRAAGCVINDYADRHFDGHVERTRSRPLALGLVTPKQALGLFTILCLLAFCLVLLTNPLTIKLAFGGVFLAVCYPFMKRYTHLPQIVLGAAFSWAIPMAFAAETGGLPSEVWLIYIANLLWTVVYDTFYAMVDRPDDVRIGIKSTAILFGHNDRLITGVLQLMVMLALILVGVRFQLGFFYFAGVTAAAGLFAYQQYLIRYRDRQDCFRAFLNNNWVGMVIFIGIVLDTSL